MAGSQVRGGGPVAARKVDGEAEGTETEGLADQT